MFKFKEGRSSEIKTQVPLSVRTFYPLTVHQICLIWDAEQSGKLGKFLVRTLRNASTINTVKNDTFLYHFKMKSFLRMIE